MTLLRNQLLCTQHRCSVQRGIAFVCRYWNNPEVLKKLGGAMGGTFSADQLANGAEAGEAAAAGGQEEEEDEEPNVHSAASTGASPLH